MLLLSIDVKNPTVEYRFFDPPRETEFGSKNRESQKIAVKNVTEAKSKGNNFRFEESGVSE